MTLRTRALAVRKKIARIIAADDIARGLRQKWGAQFRKALDGTEICNLDVFPIRFSRQRSDKSSAPRHAVNKAAFTADVVCAGHGGEIHVQPVGQLALRRQTGTGRKRTGGYLVGEPGSERKVARTREQSRIGLPA